MSTDEKKVLIILIINVFHMDDRPHHSSQLWQGALNIEEYDWYGYGETYGRKAELRPNYRYKQV